MSKFISFVEKCEGCGEDMDLPWGYCADCTATLLDTSRPVAYRLNPPEVLQAQIEKMLRYEESKQRTT